MADRVCRPLRYKALLTHTCVQLPDDISLLQLEYDEDMEESWRRILSPEEIDRLSGMRSRARRRSFTLGRITVRRLLAGRLHVDPAVVPLSVWDDGRVVVDGSDLHISIAHSGERAVAIVSEHPVGVDIELVVEKPQALLDYILHEDEKSAIEELPLDRNHKLFLCWTLKEAVLKASGTGLRRSPRSARLQVDLAGGTATVLDAEDRLWRAVFEKQGAYFVAVAYQAQD